MKKERTSATLIVLNYKRISMDSNDSVVAGLNTYEVNKIVKIEETDLEVAKDNLRIPRPLVSDVSALSIELATKAPVQVYRYGGDENEEINRTILDLFTELRDAKIEDGEPLPRGPLFIHTRIIRS